MVIGAAIVQLAANIVHGVTRLIGRHIIALKRVMDGRLEGLRGRRGCSGLNIHTGHLAWVLLLVQHLDLGGLSEGCLRVVVQRILRMELLVLVVRRKFDAALRAHQPLIQTIILLLHDGRTSLVESHNRLNRQLVGVHLLMLGVMHQSAITGHQRRSEVVRDETRGSSMRVRVQAALMVNWVCLRGLVGLR